MNADGHESYCPYFHSSIELIGRRWTGAILMALFSGSCRFGDIRDSIPGLSDRLLAERLKELSEAGIVSRCSDSREVSYFLTARGLDLKPVFDSLSEWTNEWACQEIDHEV